jgi:hypothetical protein
MLPGTAGSSMNRTSYGLMAAANWISAGGDGAVGVEHDGPVRADALARFLDHAHHGSDVRGVI